MKPRHGTVRRALAGAFGATLLALTTPACVAEGEDEERLEEEMGSTTEEMRASGLATTDMVRIATPAGMPRPWDQPDSTGWFDERGKCGPTAVANILKLYGINVSPKDADEDGVHWVIGSRDVQIRDYLEDEHPQLDCSIEHPTDGARFLRSELNAGHPVMVWFNTSGFLQSHWVVVVGVRGKGAAEHAIVMSWGRYYKIPMAKLIAAWRSVYFTRFPSVVCNATTRLIVR